MKHILAVVWLTAVVAVLAITATVAHEVTYKGVVAVVEPNPYAASDGVLATLELKVSDRQRTLAFDVTRNTKLWRGDTLVPFDAAHIEKDEPAAVTINHEEPEAGALEIRLAAQR